MSDKMEEGLRCEQQAKQLAQNETMKVLRNEQHVRHTVQKDLAVRDGKWEAAVPHAVRQARQAIQLRPVAVFFRSWPSWARPHLAHKIRFWPAAFRDRL